MKGLFWTRWEARLRAGWRIVLFVVASGIASTALGGPGRRVLGRLLPVVYANVVEVVVLVLLIGVLCGWPPDGSTVARSLTMAFT
jgi:hypothetical protein